MNDLSLHVLDIAHNSLAAGATRVAVGIGEEGGLLTVTVSDNGRGMSPEFLAAVTDPFTTTRTTRKVGLGIPLLKMAAEQTGGTLRLESEPGVGTTLVATFAAGHIDAPPLGDMPATIITLVQGAPEVDFLYTRTKNGVQSGLDTAAVRAELDGVPLNEPEVLSWIEQSLRESEEQLNDSV